MYPLDDQHHDQFLRLFAEQEPALRTFARLLLPLRDDVSGVMQEVAVTLWQKFGEFDTTRDFRKWAFGIVRYKVLGPPAGSGARPPMCSMTSWVNRLADDAAAMDQRHDAQREALEACLQKLPEPQRALVLAAYTKGTRMDELAAERGQSAMSFYKLLQRIRQALLGMRAAHDLPGGTRMNNAHWHLQIQRCMAGDATPEEIAALQQALMDDAELRVLYLDYLNLDMALGMTTEATAIAGNEPAGPRRFHNPPPGGQRTTGVGSLRPRPVRLWSCLRCCRGIGTIRGRARTSRPSSLPRKAPPCGFSIEPPSLFPEWASPTASLLEPPAHSPMIPFATPSNAASVPTL